MSNLIKSHVSFLRELRGFGINPKWFKANTDENNEYDSLMILEYDDFWGDTFDDVMTISDGHKIEVSYMAYDSNIEHYLIESDGYTIDIFEEEK